MSRSIQMFAPIGRAWFQAIEGGAITEETHDWVENQSATSEDSHAHRRHTMPLSAVSASIRKDARDATRIWIEDKEHAEHSFLLSTSLLPVENGHIVKIVWGGKIGDEGGTILYARNHVSKREIRYSAQEIWNWAYKAGLANYPLAYRLIFYWLPVVFAVYLLLVFNPMFNIMRYENIIPSDPAMSLVEIGNIFNAHFKYLAWWKWEAVVKEIYSMQALDWFLFGVLTLALHSIGRMLGYVLLGRWIRPLIIYPLTMAVQELTEGPTH